MKKLLYLLPVIALLLASCTKQNELNGTFANKSNDGKMVYLLSMKSLKDNFEPIDSVIVQNGKFKFKLKETTEPSVGYIVVKEAAEGTPNGIPFVYENGTIEVVIDSVAKTSGTPMNDKCQVFFNKLSDVVKQLDALDLKIYQATDDVVRQGYMSQMDALNKQMGTIGYDFVKENIKNKVGEFYFISFMGVFSDEQVKELQALSSPEHQKLIEEILSMKQAQNGGGGFVGKKYIDVKGDSPAGKKIALSDYVGKNKLVLVDFWASWCGPCVQEMPNVVKAYAAYKSKGFEIVGISLDEDKAAWTGALTRMNMTWPQMSDLKGWGSELSAPYHVQGIPFTLLIDQDGNIIAENLRGDQLEQKLAELLK